MIEDNNHLVGIPDPLRTHFLETGADPRDAPVVHHDVVGFDVNDLADIYRLAAGVAGDNLRQSMHGFTYP